MRKSELLRLKTNSLLKFSMYLFVFVIVSTSFTNIPKTRNGEVEDVIMSRAKKKSDLTKVYTRKKNTEDSDRLVLHFIGKYVQHKYELHLGESIQKGKFVEIIKNGDVYYYLKDAKGKVKKVFMCSGNDATIFELNSKNEKVDTLYLKYLK